ncbi:hypothetical protein EKL30_00300 [Candidimonas sp. SYP-B2681]|uniref:hypothetical protein n=1 Tax=Candidimonas sp. SYP-B2681 TaxID=2497686 RepID=UPI000F88618E|nr:hypothetical protein [Candidimonas sp. SYP-B2681]RTZ47491.1 hypothetical protein EKL30_00300 [Candidimonas sp. SYP-B2681]
MPKNLIGKLRTAPPVDSTMGIDDDDNPFTDADYARLVVEAYEHARRANAYTPPSGDPDVDMVTEIRGLYQGSKHGVGFQEHVAAGGEVTGIVKRFAGSMRTLDIRSTRIASQQPNDDFVFHATARAPVETNRLSANIIVNSLVSQAGARIIITEDRPSPMVGDIIAYYSDAGVFRLVEAASFAHIPDGDEVAESAHPFFNSLISMGDSFAYAFRTKVTRKQLRDVGGNSTMDALSSAITLGLANLADRVLLAEILRNTPGEYSVAKAASRGLRFHELNALVGTAGSGAVVENGKLNVSGIRAELTSASTDTVIGAFNRCAVAIYPIVQVMMERTNLNGDMLVTSWVNMVPLVPDPSAFWTVS